MKTEKEPLWMASWQSLVTLARAASWSSGVNVILNWGGMQGQQVSMTSSVAGAGLGGGVKRCFSFP